MDKRITLAQYVQIWLRDIAPDKPSDLSPAEVYFGKHNIPLPSLNSYCDIDRFLSYLGGYKLTELRPEHFRRIPVAMMSLKYVSYLRLSFSRAVMIFCTVSSSATSFSFFLLEAQQRQPF